ncbi:hypothetical protein FPE01S_01_05220 [Flavihumibacter petaseus NBRC 106054]|uniref:DUF4350 domain-containing protein n=2 Tax=Flavihumibacter TaxID=1004301 RepID=A0A0E9MVJ8_9BACT|nr:hypothetical protein FPE01S_01_05220 [Flavihumibacter petaseus NBRC 106054]
MILLAAVWLAGPVWQKEKSDKRVKGWVLVPREGIGRNRIAIDSLIHQGFRLHAWEKAFPEIEMGDTAGTAQHRYDHFTLLDAIERRAPAGMPLVLFTPDNVQGFSGPKPKVNRPVDWRLYHDQQPKELASAARLPRKIWLYRDSEKFLRQDQHLAAAIRSLQYYFKDSVQLIHVNDPGRVRPDSNSVLFWLSTRPLPAMTSTGLILQADTTQQSAGRIIWQSASGNDILWQPDPAKNIHRLSVAEDGAGGIASLDDLPERLYWLFQPGSEQQRLTRLEDRIDPSALVDFPSGKKNNATPTQMIHAALPVDSWMTGLLILLFVMERWLRWRKTKT